MLPVRAWCVRVAGSTRMVRNIPKNADWCAKKSSGKFIRGVLTLNLLAAGEVHAGQVRALLEHLDVACSYIVRGVFVLEAAGSSIAHRS